MALNFTDDYVCPLCEKAVRLAHTDWGYVLSCGTDFDVEAQTFRHRCTDGHPEGCLCAPCRSRTFGVTHV